MSDGHLHLHVDHACLAIVLALIFLFFECFAFVDIGDTVVFVVAVACID